MSNKMGGTLYAACFSSTSAMCSSTWCTQGVKSEACVQGFRSEVCVRAGCSEARAGCFKWCVQGVRSEACASHVAPQPATLIPTPTTLRSPHLSAGNTNPQPMYHHLFHLTRPLQILSAPDLAGPLFVFFAALKP